MIQHDQPTIFGNTIIAAVSSVEDGTMSFAQSDPEETRFNRQAFLDRAGVDPFQATLLQVTFDDTTDFARYRVIDDDLMGEGMMEPVSDTVADALVVTRPEQAIFLPLADCAGAIIYDPANQVLMVSHLGRHSVEVNGGGRGIEYLKQEFDSDPAELLVWLSPAVGSKSYPLYALDNRGLHEVIIEQMTKAGVRPQNIEASHVDTAESPDYFSHSEFLAGNRSEDGRFAIIAMMVE
jgi:copper oxidase (laccase) domain-containing protein